MTGRRFVVLALCGAAASACGTKILQTAGEPGSLDASPAQATCGPRLTDRLSVSTIDVDANVRYKRRGYDWFPEDERIAFGVSSNGESRVAWLEDDLERVHVTPLTTALTRSVVDAVVEGVDVGGLAAADDGFALLTRRADPGEPLRDPAAGDAIATAAFLVRVRSGAEVFAAPLTGTRSITNASGTARDCSTTALRGRLAFNGSKYGAYFEVHGCEGDVHAPYYGDKLAYVDGEGAWVPGGWDWKCSISQGMLLLPEPSAFTALCLADGSPFPGLNLVVESLPARQLAPEMTEGGYTAGKFGSVVKMGDGSYVVAWLSRGTTDTFGGPPAAAKKAHDIALIRLGSSYETLSPIAWLAETPDIEETNLHLAPYGPDRLFVSWDSIGEIRCDVHTCFGTYTGTHGRLIGPDGTFLTEDALLTAVPNSAEDIAVFPNGDLGWAFVAEKTRSYGGVLPLDTNGNPDVPKARQLSVARLKNCAEN